MKIYDKPKVGDKVWHIDEPTEECYGIVEDVLGDEHFAIRWYDGEVESYEVNDHPDIILL